MNTNKITTEELFLAIVKVLEFEDPMDFCARFSDDGRSAVITSFVHDDGAVRADIWFGIDTLCDCLFTKNSANAPLWTKRGTTWELTINI